MKAIFLKQTNKCIAICTYCQDGKEHELVNYDKKDIIVKKVPEDIMQMIDDVQNPVGFRSLELENGDIVINTDPIVEIIKESNREKDMAFVLDSTNPIEERFNLLLKLLKSRSAL